MQGRTINVRTKTTDKTSPGPAAYSPKETMSKTGNNFVSKYRSSLAPSFSQPTLDRFHKYDP